MAGDFSAGQDSERSKSKILLILGILATLTAVAAIGGGKLKQILKINKMTNEVVLLNNAVRAFKTDGGKFFPEDTLDSVITALKSVDPGKTSPELRGFILNKRFAWKMQTMAQAATGDPRTVWNPTTMKFELLLEGQPGAYDFRIGSEETNTEDNSSRFDYAQKSGWELNYDDEPEKTSGIEPTRVNIGGNIDIDDSPDWIPVSLTSYEGTEDHSKDLKTPEFSIPEGTYPTEDFDLKIAISNPNPKESTSVIWSINYGPWTTYEDSPVTVGQGDTLLAIAKPIDTTSATNSPSASATYEAAPPKMATLSFADPGIDFGGTGNHYFLDIGGSNATMGLLVSDSTPLRLATKTHEIAANGDTCAFWVSDGFKAGSTTITMDFNENPITSVNFMVYNVNVLNGGDKITIEAKTGEGVILNKPHFTFKPNAPDGITYDPELSEADVNVEFASPEGDYVTEITLKWEASDPSSVSPQSIGLGEVSFSLP